MTYSPDAAIIERYAGLLVKLALGNRRGVARGDVVLVSATEDAKPMFVALRNAVLRAGATCIADYIPTGVAREAFELASLDQLATFHRAYYRGLAEAIDHRVLIRSSSDPRELDGVDPGKLMLERRTTRPYRVWLDQKEAEGRYSWTLASYGTPAMAKEARLSHKAYWEQIIEACFLDDPNPIRRWRETFREIDRIKKRLDRLEIESLHIEGEGVDLRIAVGPDRQWLGASGHNIPSFEVFISPNFRGTEGTVAFTEPLYRYGSLIEGVRLVFEKGRVVEASASRNQDLLLAMVASDEGSSRVGEVSLTDGRLSPITRYMADTLYDENRGGPEGNFHLALGNAYKDAFTGETARQTRRDWRRLGFNESTVHTDIVSTARRQATAHLPGGRTKVVYRDGQFTI
jgi:aminopeptidase